MRDYEIVYIFRSNFTAEEIEARLERYHALITGDGKGEITAVEQWGKRQLAYPILREKNGYYVVAQFSADSDVLPALERSLKLEEDLLRYLIVLSEGELPIPQSMREELQEHDRRRSGDDDDDDDDEREDDDDDEDDEGDEGDDGDDGDNEDDEEDEEDDEENEDDEEDTVEDDADEPAKEEA